MRFNVRHTTRYRYSRPVTLGPQRLRFRPRDGAGQRCIAHTLSIDPLPVGRTEDLDAEGNPTEVVWFGGPTDRLQITALLTVEIVRENPFDFLIEAHELPVDYGESAALLTPSMARVPGKIPAGDPVAKLAAGLAERFPQPIAFLTALNDEIHRRCPVRRRETGAPLTPAQALENGGACRDLAVLFMDAARTRDLACRFVSGYTSPPNDGGEPELHAWAEVYLPG
ncbi:MAG: transglutaminase N-terminal domain-containing protein, partial [Planctomycetota bacterium]